MITLIAIIISLSFFSFNFFVNADIFYPPALFCLLWSIVLIAYSIFILLNGENTNEIDVRSIGVFIGGEVLFTVGGLLAANRKIKKEIPKTIPYFKYPIDKYLFIILLILFPLYLYKLYGIITSSDYQGPNFLMALRYEFSVQETDIGPIKYINTLALFAFTVGVYKFNFTEGDHNNTGVKIYRFFFYILIILYSVLSSGRTYILFLFCVFFGSKIITNKIKLKYYLIFPVVLFAVFSISGLLLEKGGSIEDSFASNLISVTENFILYFLGGIYAFNSVIAGVYHIDYGQNTFRFFQALSYATGLTQTAPKDIVMPYTSTTPIMTNVYTLYYPYIKDFWYFGLGFLLLWSFLHTYFYYRAKKGFVYFFWYGALLYPLLMSFFEDQYTGLLSTWIQLIVLCFVANFFIGYKKIQIL